MVVITQRRRAQRVAVAPFHRPSLTIITLTLTLSTLLLCCTFLPSNAQGLCPAGQYFFFGCWNCEAGNYCANSVGIRCFSGTYQDQTGQSSCKDCPTGRYEDGRESTACKLCPAGRYGDGTKFTSVDQCKSCPAGFYSSATGAVACSGCPAGKSSPAGSSSCTNCPAGTFSTSGSTCMNCPAGRFSQSPGSPSCPMCPSGTWIDTVKATVCKNCVAGRSQPVTAPPVSPVSEATCVFCPVGRYNDADGLGGDCPLCLAGRLCDDTGLTIQPLCPAGYRCPTPGITVPVACSSSSFDVPESRYCPAGSTSSIGAPDGWYTLPEGFELLHRENATICPPSYTCDSGRRLPCPTGRFSSMYGRSINLHGPCPACEVAHYCPEGQGVMLPCPPGTYNPDTIQLACKACPKGMYCETTQLANPTGSCGPGTYANTTGFITCANCHPGAYCPDGTDAILCRLGTYNPSALSTSESDCIVCPAGKYGSAVGGRSVDVCLPCPAGSYCAGVTGNSTLCAAGRYSNATGLTSECTPVCPEGSYCPEGSTSPVPCPAGRYGNVPALTSSTCTDLCNPGFYCPEGAARQESCPAGRYGESPGLPSLECSGLCDPGYFCLESSVVAKPPGQECGGEQFYCPAGSPASRTVSAGNYTAGGTPLTRHEALVCNMGSYCPGDGLLYPCPAGRYGNEPSLAAVSCSGQCPPGYFCPEATTNATQFVCGNATVFCPPGSPSPFWVSPGYYTSPFDGPPATRSGQQFCEAGHYCVQGERLPCSAGRWSDAIGATSPCIDLCDAGYYCPAGSVGPRALECGAVDVFCPAGSGSPLPVPAGKYSAGGSSARTQVEALLCPPGQGKYCPGDGLQHDCHAGRFGSPGGLSTPACSGPCLEGYYCPAGSPVADAVECGGEDKYCQRGSPAPSAVPVGWYSTPDDGNPMTRTGVAKCAAGTYCFNGARFKCAAGTYNPSSGREGPCNAVCHAGYFCDEGTIVPSVRCVDRAVFCPPGTPSVRSVLPSFFSLTTGEGLTYAQAPCRPGSYCQGGVDFPCPAGRYGLEANETSANCTGICVQGYFCPPGSTSPMQEPCGGSEVVCPAGTPARVSVPPGRMSLPLSSPPELRYFTGPCPVGSFCTNGNRTLCPAGRFGDSEELATRLCAGPCAAGHFCTEGSLVPEAHACGAPSFFCPEGSGAPVRALPGEYTAGGNSSAFRTHTLSCEAGNFCLGGLRRPCPAGRYGCSTHTSSPGCNGPCAAGFYCPEGSTSNQQVACGSGVDPPYSVFCPANASSPTLSSVGFYTEPLTGLGDSPTSLLASGADRHARQHECQPGWYCIDGARELCPEGRYGNVSGLTTPNCSDVCADGYLCPAGSTSPFAQPCPTGYFCRGGRYDPCPAGRYNPDEGAVAVDSCLPCPAGTYSSSLGTPSLAKCLPCAPLEGSAAGSPVCWPGILEAVASDPAPVFVGLSEGDTLTLTFTKPTNRPPVASTAQIEALVTLSAPIGDLSGQWLFGGSVLRIAVVSKAGAAPNPDDYEVGNLTVSHASGTPLRDANLLSSPITTSEPRVTTGTWGVPTAPEIVHAVASNTGNQAGLGAGDSVCIVFDQEVRQLPLGAAGALEALLEFKPPISSATAGFWLNRTALQVTVLAPVADPSPSHAAASQVGSLVVSVRRAANLTSFNGQSDASNASAVVARGSWGDLAVSSLEPQSPTALRLTVFPPPSRFAYVVRRYLVQWIVEEQGLDSAPPLPASWDEAAALAEGLETSNSSSVVSAQALLDEGDGVKRRLVSLLDDRQGGAVLVEIPDAMLTSTGEPVESSFLLLVNLLPGVSYVARVAADNAGFVGPASPSTPEALAPLAPVVFAVNTPSGRLSTTGGDLVRLAGLNFGRAGQLARVRHSNGVYAGELTGCMVTENFVAISCVSVPSVGAHHAFAVHVEADIWTPYSSENATLSYAAPSVTGFAGEGSSNALTAGNQTVTVIGRGFGPASLVPPAVDFVSSSPLGLDYSFLAQGCQVVSDDTVISCRTGAGVGRSLTWTVGVAGQASASPITHYGPPAVHMVGIRLTPDSAVNRSDALRSSLQTSGGQILVLRGENFGGGDGQFLEAVYAVSDLDRRVLEPPACSVTTPHTEITCTLPPAVGAQYRWQVVVGGQVSLPSADTVGYQPPVVTSVDPVVVPTSGGKLVTLSGSQFGPTADGINVVVGGQRVQSVVVTSPHTQFTFESPEAEGFTLSLVVFVGGQAAPISWSPPPAPQALEIGAPFVSSLSLDTSPSDGEDTLLCSDAASISSGISSSNSTVRVVVRGGNFGAGPFTSVSIAGMPCTINSALSSHDVIVCRTSRCWGDLVVRVSGTRLASRYYDYLDLSSPPSIFGASPLRSPTSGGDLLTLVGSDFKATGEVEFREVGTDGEFTGRLSFCEWDGLPGTSYQPDRIVCRIPPGSGSMWQIFVIANTIRGRAYVSLFQYEYPTVFGISPTVAPPTARPLLSIYGTNFGEAAAFGSVLVGGLPCEPLTFWNDTMIQCQAPTATAPSLQVTVQVSDQTSDQSVANGQAPVAMTFLPPRMTAMSPSSGPTSGGTLMHLVGEQLVSPIFTVRVWFSHHPPAQFAPSPSTAVECLVVNATADQVWCLSPEGSGRTVFVYLENVMEGCPSQSSPDRHVFSYHPPVITSLGAFDVAGNELPFSLVPNGRRPAVGGFPLVVNGTNLSLHAIVVVGGEACVPITHLPGTTISVTSTHTSVYCLAPPRRADASLQLWVDARGQVSNSLPFRFDRPVIATIAPNRIDARNSLTRSALNVIGRNFAPRIPGVSANHTIVVGNHSCARVLWMGDTEVRCVLDIDLVVGFYNVTASVGDDVSDLSPSTVVQALCVGGFFGRIGEQCRVCPSGAVCAGGFSDPVARPGFYPQEYDNFPACYPSEACVGGTGDPCSTPYTAVRCSECAAGYYRLQQKCKACPSQAWLLFVGLFVAVAFFVASSIYLSRKKINLAGLSIGIDFLQVLSMFATFQFDWPVSIQFLFNIFSLTNFNVELVAPECSISFNYAQKWFTIQALPLFMVGVPGVLVAAAVVLKFFRSRCRSQRSILLQTSSTEDSIGLMIDSAIGVMITGLYYLYFVVVRNALAPFDCVVDDTGTKVMELEPSVVCNETGGVHGRILPWAGLSILVYGVGTPLMFGYLIWNRRRAIHADQTLRAAGEGDTPETNPHLKTRRRFRKLYEDFRPSAYGWKLLLIFRKFALAMTTMMVNGNPLFQASVTILLLFGAYVLHVRFRPFLSAKSVSKSFATLASRRRGGAASVTSPLFTASAASSAHRNGRIPRANFAPSSLAAAAAAAAAASASPSTSTSSSVPRAGAGAGAGARAGARAGATTSAETLPPFSSPKSANPTSIDSSLVKMSLQARSKILSFVVDYNTLESAFLISAMMILLSGLVFSSAAFKSGSVSYVILTFLITATIVISVSTFVYLLTFEIFRALKYSKLHQTAAKVEKALLRRSTATRKLAIDIAGSPSQTPQPRRLIPVAAASDASPGPTSADEGAPFLPGGDSVTPGTSLSHQSVQASLETTSDWASSSRRSSPSRMLLDSPSVKTRPPGFADPLIPDSKSKTKTAHQPTVVGRRS